MPLLFEDEIRAAVRTVYQQIKTETGATTTILALGYPQLFAKDECQKALGISEEEQEFLIYATEKFNEMLTEVAADEGVHFRQVSFAGHELCSDDPWVNGVIPSMTKYKGSMHPNTDGQGRYAQEVTSFLDVDLSYQHGFYESGMPKNPPAAGP